MKIKHATIAMMATALLAGCCHVQHQPLIEPSTLELRIIRAHHAPIIANIDITRDLTHFEPIDATITAKVYSGPGGGDWSKVNRSVSKKLTVSRFNDLWSQATNLNFRMVLHGTESILFDGSTWMLTIRRGNGASMTLALRCPVDSEDPDMRQFVAVCDSILQLADIELPKDEKY
jgi:hypothetical protein